MATLLECLNSLNSSDGETVYIASNADTWDLDNLIEVVESADEDDTEYAVSGGCIHRVDSDGYLVFPPDFEVVESPEDGEAED